MADCISYICIGYILPTIGEYMNSWHPLTSREPTPARGVALVHSGQRPISLEYQINPPSLHLISDTLVTGLALGTQSWLKIWKQEPVWQLLMGEMVSKNNMPKMIWNMLKIVWNMVKVIWNMPKIMSIFDNVLHSSSLASRRWRVWWV